MSKNILLFIAIAMATLFASCTKEAIVPKPYNQGINLTPKPLELVEEEGEFELNEKTVFISNSEECNKIASFFAEKLQIATGYKLGLQNEKPATNFISLDLDQNLGVKEEGYELVSDASGITIKAKSAKGIFYGMQTVLQLLPAEIESPVLVKYVEWKIPAVTIKDEPRFQYRGHHIDVCRHFPSVEFLKKQIDLLAMFKFNILHWHLTDDQAWRVEIKKYPKLAEIGSVRKEGDGSTYGPYFYTQEEIKEVVAYAAERFVEVIPELELPGHAVAAAAAYPNLICTGENIEVRNYWGISVDVFCAGNEEVFTFLEDVIDELVPLFPSKFFHIGGDECLKERWEECPKCQARIKSEGIKATDGYTKEQMLQSYFVKRIAKVIDKHNKVMIGWDEIVQGGLPNGAVVMSWTGEKPGAAVANQGHDVIMTPGEYMYLDKYQGESKVLPVTIGGVKEQNNMLPLAKVYSYNPIPEGLSADKEKHILGVQANSWHEYKYNEDDMHHDMFPRLAAVAEVGWTAKDKKDYSDFECRIDNQRVRLDMHEVNYYIPRSEQIGVPSSNHVAFIDNATLAFATTEPVKMVYTINGEEPTLSSNEYKEPLIFSETMTLKIRSVLVSEKMGETRTILVEKQAYTPAVGKAADSKPGLLAEYYKGNTLQMSDLENMKPFFAEYVKATYPSKYRVKDYKEIYDETFHSSAYTGYINIPEDGVYYFSTDCELWIDDNQLISNAQNVNRARRFSRYDSAVALAKGYHKFKVVQLGATFGGWPTQWEDVRVGIRNSKDDKFTTIGASYFD